MKPSPASPAVLTNAQIAERLTSLAQLMAAQKENPFKIKAYRRAAETLRAIPDSIAELVGAGEDLTQFAGIGAGISSAIREIVETGGLRRLDSLRAEVSPEVAALTEHPRLDPKRVVRIYKALGIGSIEELRAKLESGELAARMGSRLEHHVRQGLIDVRQMLLFDVHEIVDAVKRFLLDRCGVERAEVTGEVRRRVEVVGEISFLVETADFAGVAAKLERYGGGLERVSVTEERATFRMSSGVLLTIEAAKASRWGLALMVATGSAAHLEQLQPHGFAELSRGRARVPTEAAAYRNLGLSFIEPELREGHDEVSRAASGTLPKLVTVADIRGELHAHSTSSDGAHTIAEMVAAARERSYEYLGITDHSQSLKIARGLPVEDLWAQIRAIDKLNSRLRGFRVLKSAEVDILADGSLDYPDDLLRELDYTVCSIHSRFGLDKAAQTNRILRAMENPHFTILGHATGRLLLRRTGYEIDVDQVIAQARDRGCFVEINSSPDRLDLSAENARTAHAAGLKIAINTDAHSIAELDFIQCGVGQARRAGLGKRDILNCLGLADLLRAIAR